MRGRTRAIVGCSALLTLAGAASALGAGDKITTVVGNGTGGFAGDSGPATAAALYLPQSASELDAGGYLVADAENNRIRRVWPDGSVTTVAGTGTTGYNGDGIDATTAQLDEPQSVTPTPDGGFVFADVENNRVRKVSAAGVISTIAGTGAPGYNGDDIPATTATLSDPEAVALLPGGGYLIADKDNNRIRHVRPDGKIETVAGNGTGGFSGDGGPAVDAQLQFPHDVSPTRDDGFLIADRYNQRIRRVGANGNITTVAGSTPGFAGDGGPATEAQLIEPPGVAATADGGFLIADYGNHRVRRVAPGGTISTVAGSGTEGYGGDGGSATAADLYRPVDVSVTDSGGYLIADMENHRIRFVDADYRPRSRNNPSAGPKPKKPKETTAAVDPELPALPPPVAPQVGRSAQVAVARGTVLVTLPGTRRRVPLGGAASIPMGATVDTTRGAVRLTSASGRAGRPQTAVFSKGAFRLRQRRTRRPVTELVLRGGDFSRCRSRRGAASAAKRGRARRRLWGRGQGRFRTRGRYGAATVRGTIWLTEDRCSGTLTAVRRGVVAVRDLRTRRTRLVRAGMRYLARAPSKRRRR